MPVERDDARAYALLYAALKIGIPTGLREASYDLLGRLAARLNETERPAAGSALANQRHE